MADNQPLMTDEEALQAAVAWGKERYADADVRGRVADRMGDDVYVHLEMPEERAVMMVHVRRNECGGIMIDQQERP
jgi:hypothetical protein